MSFHDLGIATCSYSGFDPEMGTPVRTSQGHPRFRLSYDLLHSVPALMPIGLRDVHDLDEFTPRYFARLDAHAGEIAEALAAIAATSGLRPVLLCFEDLWKDDGTTWCHRRVAAQWLEERTGLTVPELSLPKPPSARRSAALPKVLPEMTLFGQVDVPRRTR